MGDWQQDASRLWLFAMLWYSSCFVPQNGLVLKFDMRQTSSPLATLKGLSSSPIHTLQYVPEGERSRSGGSSAQEGSGLLSASSSSLLYWPGIDLSEESRWAPEFSTCIKNVSMWKWELHTNLLFWSAHKGLCSRSALQCKVALIGPAHSISQTYSMLSNTLHIYCFAGQCVCLDQVVRLSVYPSVTTLLLIC